tara:strand:+ start:363 stop:503 length:141 start_codon:yes stop_codon:yes gene_type:complete
MKLQVGQSMEKEVCPHCQNVGEFYQIFSEMICCAKCKKMIKVEFEN